MMNQHYTGPAQSFELAIPPYLIHPLGAKIVSIYPAYPFCLHLLTLLSSFQITAIFKVKIIKIAVS